MFSLQVEMMSVDLTFKAVTVQSLANFIILGLNDDLLTEANLPENLVGDELRLK